MLLRMVRGAGTSGLGGIAPVSGVWIRPLLEISRAELRASSDSPNADVAGGRDQRRPVAIRETVSGTS